jgi:hypothetical protein
MSMRSEDMAPVRSRRVHGDQKRRKILLGAYEGEHQASREKVQGLEVKTRRYHLLEEPPT